MPVSSSRVAVHGDCAPPARDSPNTISVDASAPTKAAGITATAMPASIADSAATAAPPGDSQHVRIGQRIAQQDLQQRAGEREQPADGERRQRARQPQLAHDRDGRVRAFAHQRAEDGGRVDGNAAGGERDGERGKRRTGERGRDQQRATGSRRGPRTGGGQ